MSYIVTIRRIPNEGDPHFAMITKEDWGQVVASDPTLEAGPDGMVAFWNAHPKKRPVSFVYDEGEVMGTSTPDYAMLQKMQEIAQKLNARMQGEEGEFLDEVDYSKYRDNQIPKGCCLCIAVCAVAFTTWLVWHFFF